MATITISFWRDEYSGPACLEYSYVPEGRRRTIHLPPGKQEVTQTDTVSDTLNASHVQVYTLANNGLFSISMWQFPPGPPHALPVVSAQVSVVQSRMLVAGLVTYLDATMAAGATPLELYPRPCPQELPVPLTKRKR